MTGITGILEGLPHRVQLFGDETGAVGAEGLVVQVHLNWLWLILRRMITIVALSHTDPK